jgi:hypothetical protein
MYSCSGNASNLEIAILRGASKSHVLKRWVFWLTECPLISTASSIIHCYTGAVRVKQVVSRFQLGCGSRSEATSYKIATRAGKKIAQLVAEFTPKSHLSVNSLAVVIDNMDDMLLLVSFAARRRYLRANRKSGP